MQEKATLPGATSVHAFVVVGPGEIWAEGRAGTSASTSVTNIFHLDRGQWVKAWSDTPGGGLMPDSMWGSSKENLWLFGDRHIHYDGQKWTDLGRPSPGPRSMDGLWGSSASDIWAVSWNQIWHYAKK